MCRPDTTEGRNVALTTNCYAEEHNWTSTTSQHSPSMERSSVSTRFLSFCQDSEAPSSLKDACFCSRLCGRSRPPLPHTHSPQVCVPERPQVPQARPTQACCALLQRLSSRTYCVHRSAAGDSQSALPCCRLDAPTWSKGALT